MENDFIEMVMTGRYNNIIKLSNDTAIFKNYTKVLSFIQKNECNVIDKINTNIYIDKDKLYYKQENINNDTLNFPQNIIFISNNLCSSKLTLLLNYMKKAGMNINFIYECEICKKYKEKLFLQNNNFTLNNLYMQMKTDFNTICLCYRYNNISSEIINIDNEQYQPYVKYIEIIPHYTFLEYHHYILDAINTPIIVYIC